MHQCQAYIIMFKEDKQLSGVGYFSPLQLTWTIPFAMEDIAVHCIMLHKVNIKSKGQRL